MKEIATKWIKRSAHHWKHNANSNSKELDKICNQKEKVSKPLATRTRQAVSQFSSKILSFSKKAKIFLWHYHPKIIEYFHNQNCSTIPRTVSLSLMRDLGLYGQGAGALCTAADTITVSKETLALVLPVYNLSQAKKDSLSSIEDWNNEQVLKNAIMHSSEGIGSLIILCIFELFVLCPAHEMNLEKRFTTINSDNCNNSNTLPSAKLNTFQKNAKSLLYVAVRTVLE